MYHVNIIKTDLKEIEALRILFLHENNFQFIYNKCHLYGWADTYLFLLDNLKIGYGAVWGQSKREDRDTIFEFYILEPYRKLANECFSKLQALCKTPFIECQSNDALLSGMMYEYAENINAEAILFKDEYQTDFKQLELLFEEKKADTVNQHHNREYVLYLGDHIVSTGGLMLNYNVPYADIYYEVKEDYRKKGYGSFMVQQLKKAAYNIGREPAARCNISNTISKATLLKSGFKICGHILNGKWKNTVLH